MTLPNVQWKLDNIEEIERILEPFEARVAKDDDRLLIQAWGGLNTHLDPGDCIVLDGNRLGILRAPADSDCQDKALQSELVSIVEPPIA